MTINTRTGSPTRPLYLDQKIFVNWSNYEFLSDTDNKFRRGIGSPYEINPDNNSEIIFTRGQLVTKLERVAAVVDEFADILARPYESNRGPRIPRIRESGESPSGASVRKLKRDLVKALFEFDMASAPAEPVSYYTFSTKKATGGYRGTLRYCVNIANAFKKTIQDILNLKPGLSRALPLSDSPSDPFRVIGGIKTAYVDINVIQLQIPLLETLVGGVVGLIRDKTNNFFDESREYKTLLNLGDDHQIVADAWRVSPTDNTKLQLKLHKPLDNSVVEKYPAFISREIAKSIIDNIQFEYVRERDRTPFLRPQTTGRKDFVSGKTNNITLTTLGLVTGSAGSTGSNSVVTYGDQIFRRWYTDDFNSSELNIDFSDYSNFVTFGSAEKRLTSFVQKLYNIERLKEFLSASIITNTPNERAIEVESIIRGFDAYEQFLYHAPTSSLEYSASVDYAESGTEYNISATWPKDATETPIPPTSIQATSWLSVQLPIAQRYDENNTNYLIHSLPEYLSADDTSEEFFRFVSMVGHMFDNIKVYIDQFSNIYSTNPDPFKELTMDQVYEVATSFGVKLPNSNALTRLESFIDSVESPIGSRSLVSETWKRFLHNLIYFAKTKGTRTSFDVLLNTYGISSPILQIKEQSRPDIQNYILSDEYVYGVRFQSNTGSYISVPFVTGSVSAQTLQLRFVPDVNQNTTLLTAGTVWAIDLTTSSRPDYGRLEFKSGSSVIATSSYFELFGDDYTSLMIRSQSSGVDYAASQTDGYQILFSQTGSLSLGTWSSSYVHIGGSGSLKTLNNFSGYIDEVRVWNEAQTNNSFEKFVYDPGSYTGNTYTSSYHALGVLLAVSQPYTSLTSSILTNETPFTGSVPNITTQNLTTESYSRILRTVRQYTPIVGGSVYSNNKIRVAAAPEFTPSAYDENNVKQLSRKNSIVSLRQKEDQYYGPRNVVSFAVSPADFINQNIMRAMGIFDINTLIGNPDYQYSSSYAVLSDLQNSYIDYFEETVNPNEFIDFFGNIIESPSEIAEGMVPAKASLLTGVVIQPTLLERNRVPMKPVVADGTGTRRQLDLMGEGSGSVVSAYDYGVIHLEASESIAAGPETITSFVHEFHNIPGFELGVNERRKDNLLDANLYLTQSPQPRSSTLLTKIPPARRALQYIEGCSGTELDCVGVRSSFFDDLSAYITLRADSIDVVDLEATYTSSGYARNEFFSSVTEVNTLVPFYDVPPRSDFRDFGTTNYFYKSNGMYTTDSLINPNEKETYLAKFDPTKSATVALLYAPITLLQSQSVVSEPGRYDYTIEVGTLVAGAQVVGSNIISGLFALYNIVGPAQIRVRLYRNAQSRDNDLSRPFGILPSGSHGVQLDALLGGGSEIVFPYVLIQADDSLVYYTIDNISGISTPGNVMLSYFAYEIANLLPIGYLPRHYKFTRENTTALKRRNYIGCVNTIDTTIDGITPIQILPSQTNNIVVSSQTQLQDGLNSSYDVKFGGGGTLDVN